MGRSSGSKRAAVLGFLGFSTAPSTMAETTARGEAAAVAWQRSHHYQQRYNGTAAGSAAATAASAVYDGDGYGHYYNVDRRASEFIDRVHRDLLAAGTGTGASAQGDDNMVGGGATRR